MQPFTERQAAPAAPTPPTPPPPPGGLCTIAAPVCPRSGRVFCSPLIFLHRRPLSSLLLSISASQPRLTERFYPSPGLSFPERSVSLPAGGTPSDSCPFPALPYCHPVASAASEGEGTPPVGTERFRPYLCSQALALESGDKPTKKYRQRLPKFFTNISCYNPMKFLFIWTCRKAETGQITGCRPSLETLHFEGKRARHHPSLFPSSPGEGI